MGDRDRRGPGPIPPRWLHCPRKSTSTIGGKFVAFKTPLSAKFNDQVSEGCRFPPKMVFESMKSYKLRIGLWLDLTNTSRFYDKEVVEEENCKYIKLQCRGHGETPSEEQTRLFIQLCDQFIKHHPLEIIGVHCTHGFNRTGFLIVSYLVEKDDCSIQYAIQHFAALRPPGIYKADYLQELIRRYDDGGDIPPTPALPDWCTESDDSVDDDGEPVANGNNSDSNSPRRREFRKKNPVFMEGVPGVSPVTEQPLLQNVQRKVQEMCGWRSSGFPGCQPVSMDKDNIKLLHEKPYKVSWKADGTRYMMLILREREVFFIDRDNCVFQVSGIKFPHRKEKDRHLADTLLDGEMVIDKVKGECIPRYLAYDIIKFDGNDVGKLPFCPIRLTCIDKEIVQARRMAMEDGRINKQDEPFSIRLKQFWDVTQAGNLLSEKFSKSLSHEPDGLIFQPAKEPYVAGRCDEVLKWKPETHNSVDFKLKIVTEEGTGLLSRKVGHMYVGGMEQPFASIKINKTLKELENKIIECRFEKNQWVFMRERTDKSFPNSYKTAMAVCGSIAHPVTKAILLKYIEDNRWGLVDQDLMPPPAKAPRR